MAPRETENNMLRQNLGVTNKEHCGMLWYFWSGQLAFHEQQICKCLLEILNTMLQLLKLN